jgi:hypothetical protein
MNHRIAAWAGMIGSALFVIIFTLEGGLRPGYDPLAMYVSELSLGPRGWLQIANFVVTGTLLLAFARGAGAEFRSGKASRAGPILLAVIGAGYLASGLLVMDPTDTPREALSWHGLLHGIFGALVFTLFPITVFVFWRRFREDPAWQWFQWWTLTAGVVIASAVILLSVVTKAPAGAGAFSPWLGLIQRAAIVTYMIWLFAFALGLNRRRLPA